MGRVVMTRRDCFLSSFIQTRIMLHYRKIKTENLMMKITIDLTAQLKSKAVNPPAKLELQPPCSLQDCVRTLADECGSEFQQFLFNEKGTLRSTILMTLNDVQIDWDEHVLLDDGDRVSILSPIAGG